MLDPTATRLRAVCDKNAESYDRAQYSDVVLTCSGPHALAPVARRGLLGCIGGLIDVKHGGQIVKRYLCEPRVARRLAA